MLIVFTAKNFKSFKNELIFSMIPAPKQKGLDLSLLTEKIGSKQYKILCSAVIYGLNASGKTNMIEAMEAFKSIILRGDIRNGDDKGIRISGNILELIPNNSEEQKKPLEFSIKFIGEGILFEYSLVMDIGAFFDSDYKRRILRESLSINEKLIFIRDENLAFGDLKAIKEYLVAGFDKNRESAISIAQNSLNEDELFLMNGFKTMFSVRLINIITEWLDNKLVIVYRDDNVQIIKKYHDMLKHSEYFENAVKEMISTFGINPGSLKYMPSEDDSDGHLCTVFTSGGKSFNLSSELYESHGTVRFIKMIPVILGALLNGATLVIDEFDFTLHPSVIKNIINIFHNERINVKNSQLIFNTQNPIFLNSRLFRRDEIRFVERNGDTSTHYSLADFGTSGQKGVRKNEDYMKNYFHCEYGAIKNIDFAPIIENILYKQ